MDLAVIELSLTHAAPFHEWAEELSAADEVRYLPSNWQDFPALLSQLEQGKHAKGLPEGVVPPTNTWMVNGGERFLGKTHVRQFLTPALMEEGGHIGYMIRPSERRKGYGTLILGLALVQACACGLERVLITCDTENNASAQIIEKNGGILANYAVSTRSGKQISRYRIDITDLDEVQDD